MLHAARPHANSGFTFRVWALDVIHCSWSPDCAGACSSFSALNCTCLFSARAHHQDCYTVMLTRNAQHACFLYNHISLQTPLRAHSHLRHLATSFRL